MTTDQYISQVDSRIESLTKRYDNLLPNLQRSLYNAVITYLDGLQKDASGNLIPSAANLGILEGLDGAMLRVMQSSFNVDVINMFTDGFNRVEATNLNYFERFSGFDPANPTFGVLKTSAINTTINNISRDPIISPLANSIKTVLRTNILTGASYAEATEFLAAEIKGSPQNLGHLERYAPQIVKDSLQEFNAEYVTQASDGLGLKWYLYSGGVQTSTRPFCKARVNDYWHKNEIKSWASEDWDGKKDGTNAVTIFAYRGGYNCNHQFIPVDVLVVPDSDIERAFEKGFIKKSEYDEIKGR